MKGTVRIFEVELDAVPIARTVAQSLREASPKNVQPVDDITLAGVVVTYVDLSFVRQLPWSCRRVLLNQANELVIQHPFRRNFHFPGSSHHNASHFP